MPLRQLLRFLTQNQQVIDKLADSYPIRRAAQLTASLVHRGKDIRNEQLEKFKETEVINKMQDDALKAKDKLKARKDTFVDEIQKGFKEISKKYKDK